MDLENMINSQLEDEQKGISEYQKLSDLVIENIQDKELKEIAVAGLQKLKADEESHFAYLTLLKEILFQGGQENVE